MRRDSAGGGGAKEGSDEHGGGTAGRRRRRRRVFIPEFISFVSLGVNTAASETFTPTFDLLGFFVCLICVLFWRASSAAEPPLPPPGFLFFSEH